MVDIFSTVIKFYTKWNIQGFILMSLYLQIILFLLAPSRKRSRNKLIRAPFWFAYVMAEWVALFAVGHISGYQNCSLPDGTRADVLAFWASFLVLHLGGPDNVSTYSVEDSTFWLRQIVGLIYQVLLTITILSQPLPKKKLWISTILVFVAGTIKNIERLYAIYFANRGKYKESLIRRQRKRDHAPLKPTLDVKELEDVNLVYYAHISVVQFKGLIAEVIPNRGKRQRGRKFFLGQLPMDAFRLLEVELNLFYEAFYTKFVVVYSKSGFVFRFISWCAVLAALFIFYSIDKHGFRNIDVQITYALLFGAIGLDTFALFMLATSDWTVAYIRKYLEEDSWEGSLCRFFLPFLSYILALKRMKGVSKVYKFGCFDWVRKFLFSRWSGYLYTYNFIDYCLKERSKKNPIVFHHFTKLVSMNGFLKDFYDGIKYVSEERVKENLWQFIFTQLKQKAGSGGILQDSNLDNASMRAYGVGFDYYETLLMWHIATDLCHIKNEFDESYSICRKISKTLSDYMLYLLIMEPTLMSTVSGITKERFHHACEEAKGFFSTHVPKMKTQKKERAKARGLKLEIDANNGLPVVEPGKRTFGLSNAYNLVEELEKLNPLNRWKLISEVWVELLSYTASHCRADKHIAQLRKGGELITFVWLLMAHFGLRDDFPSYKGIANIVSKHT